MSRFSQLITLLLVTALVLLASAPLMLLLDRNWDAAPGTKLFVALLIAVAVPSLSGLGSRFVVHHRQPLVAWMTAGATGLVVGLAAALMLQG